MDIQEILNSAITQSVKDTVVMMGWLPEQVDEIEFDAVNEGLNSVIMFKGDLTGKISLFALANDAIDIVSRMLQSPVTEESADLMDGIGEVTNLIIGGIKTHCYQHDLHFDISVPMTRMAFTSSAASLNGDVLQKGFYCDGVRFSVTLAYKVIEKTAKPKQEEKPKISAADLLSQLINQQQK